ncbi:MAG: tRNA 2-thiouridine(34) synthase MnmA, partial [Methylobacteriaceae bacterium]|nr:tRNA 2-thiouridine(34) synthase MnmA [Methylobacteriaceae bacterium]
ARLRFPLGEMRKDAIRRLARELGLAVADKPDSQDICFVPSGRYGDVVARLRPEAARPGEVVDLSGRVLGRHDGIMHFTVGQRRGLGIASPEPLYVVRLEPDAARVVVGPREALATGRLVLSDLNWLGDEPLGSLPPDGLAVAVRVRSTRPPRPAFLRPRPDGGAEIELVDPEEGVAPGQACAVYADAGPRARLLGGGTILRRPAPSAILPQAA